MSLAKTTRPSAKGSVSRPRLFRRLDRARGKPVTWVWAPPGAGKSTLIASYLTARRLRSVWYRIDEGDSDIATFFYYLGQAAPRRRRPLPLLTPEYRRGLAIFSRRFFRELFSRLKTPFAVVFDNYQEVLPDAQLHEAVRDAAGEIPKGGRLICISRSEPPESFARLRTSRAIDLLDGTLLRFTRSEAAALIRRLAPRLSTTRNIERLYRVSDGWAAGLVLMVEQLARQGQASLAPGKQSSQVVFDYFAAEVFRKADLATQEILLQTAFLPRVTAAMAEELTGRPGAGEILAELERQNYFTNKGAGSESAYEFHPLFREFLLSQAARAFGSERCGEIQRKAAALAERMGQIESAAALLRNAQDWQALADLSCRHAGSLLAQGRAQTLEDWLSPIPRAKFEEIPWLLYWRGVAMLQVDPARALPLFEDAFPLFRARKDLAGALLSWCGAVDAILVDWTAFTRLDRWFEEFERFGSPIDFPSADIEARVCSSLFWALLWRRPQDPKIGRWAERALALTGSSQDFTLRALVRTNALNYYVWMGQFDRAAALMGSLREMFQSAAVLPAGLVQARYLEALYAWNTGAFQDALAAIAEGVRIAERTGVRLWDLHLRPQRIYTLLCMAADLPLARRELAAMRRDAEGKLTHLGHYHYLAGWEALLRQDAAEAKRHAQSALDRLQESGSVFPIGACHHALALSLHAAGEPAAAHRHLVQASRIARSVHSLQLEYMCHTAGAHFALDRANEAGCLEHLRKAFAIGRQVGLVSHPWWQPSVMARLCAKALEAGIEVEYVQRLIRKRGLVAETAPVEIEAWPRPLKIYTLGRFAILKDDQPLRFTGKVQRKPLALLKTIIAFGGRGVREDILMDTLWPDSAGDAARFALTSAIHRLRRLLGCEAAIARQRGEVSIDSRYCWVDLWAVERLLGRAEAAAQSDSQAASEAGKLIEKAARLYQGSFLQNDSHFPGAPTVADRVRRRLLQHLVRLGQNWEWSNHWQEAARYYEEALRVDPCAEDVCRRLMSAYHRLGRPADVVATYRHCRDALANQLGTTPTADTESLLRRLRPS
ncbi:MAG TPA: BTAD domain-containing putative transcriptional regulator [Candidatus Acidoferrales bacterium]|nr:BTAD domain-containing putative transcriptional regulator [Candidatus Acidoferrales bacterium]